ncbi:hypothetical protein DHEL01_v210277 [Diaporthe helianthi]|uniref:CENP-V/GFA domain-containing protein n=1 Tax=Diaporthe helianthi TaxID=158607 RepID=A0A2P5HM58_DIAHE|nr:hypothetical protein DHEL01_v210277 [Diaporthe helianthi]
MSTGTAPSENAKQTYSAGCHCGHIQFSVTLSPPLPEYKVLQCNCSACRRFGYLLVYPTREDVKWHGDGESQVLRYRFNTKQKDQMFCGKCGASLGIDFREASDFNGYGISARTFNGIDLDTLQYKKLDGLQRVDPPGDLSGKWHEQGAETVTKSAWLTN